ncbi:MAG: Ig-like domain-containing protein [Gemmatimonadetes bacterium]|nr:Ig-like domain-containing protein [Gemmatimonadota bacterium]
MRLEFTIQPRNGQLGTPLSPIEVRLTKPAAAAVSGSPDYVTLSLTAASLARLDGPTSAPVVDGIARFSDLFITRSGAGYRLTASYSVPAAPGSARGTASSVPFDMVVPAATQSPVMVTPAGATLRAAGATVALMAEYRDAAGAPVSGATFTWASLNPAVATVNPATGEARAVANGQVAVSATTGDGVAGYALLTVSIPGGPVTAWASHDVSRPLTVRAAWGIQYTYQAPGGTGYGSRLYAVGDNGTIVGSAGTETSSTGERLSGIWASPDRVLYVVGGSGTILRSAAGPWVPLASGTTVHLRSVSGTSASDVYAVGDGGAVLHYDGTAWSRVSVPTSADLYGVWAAAPDRVIAVGVDTIVAFDGSWRVSASGTGRLQGVYGAGADDVWAVGAGGTALHFNGTSWARSSSATTEDLLAVRVLQDAGELIPVAVGANGTIMVRVAGSWTSYTGCARSTLVGVTDVMLLHTPGRGSRKVVTFVASDGTTSSTETGNVSTRISLMQAWGTNCATLHAGLSGLTGNAWGASPDAVYLPDRSGVLRFDGIASTPVWNGSVQVTSMAGTSARDVYAVGQDGGVLHFDGANWKMMSRSTHAGLNAVWAASPQDVFAVGGRGTVLHFDGQRWRRLDSGTDQELFTVWGFSAREVFAGGDGGVFLRYDGTVWTPQQETSEGDLVALWGSAPGELFGLAGRSLVRLETSGWRTIATPFIYPLGGHLWGNSPTDLYLAQSSSGLTTTLAHFDGTTVRELLTSTESFQGLWGLPGGEVYASAGRMLRLGRR